METVPVTRMARIWIRVWFPDSKKLSWNAPFDANDMAASIRWEFFGFSVSVIAWFIESIILMNGVTKGRCSTVSLNRFILFPSLRAFVVLIRSFDMKGANIQQNVDAANIL